MRPLHAANIGSLVLYYRCDNCGHVLAVNKLDLSTPPHTVMQGTAPGENQTTVLKHHGDRWAPHD